MNLSQLLIDMSQIRFDLVRVKEALRIGQDLLLLKVPTRLNKTPNALWQTDFELVIIVEHVNKSCYEHTDENKYEIEVEIYSEQRENACFGNIVANVLQVDHGRDENARRVALLLARLDRQRISERRHDVEDEIGQHDFVQVEDDLALHH